MVSKNEDARSETVDDVLAADQAAEQVVVEAAFEEVGDENSTSDSQESVPSGPGELLQGVHLPVRVELGRRSMPLKQALRLESGSIVDLERYAEEPVDLYVNDLLFARGEVLVVNDCFCVRITEVHPRAKTMGSNS